MNTANEFGSDIVYDGQAKIELAGTKRRDSITGATVPVYEEPKFDLAASPLPAASTAVANGNTGILSAAEIAPASPVRDSGVKALDTTDQAAKIDLTIRTFSAASTALADGNAGVVATAETAHVSPPGSPGVATLESIEQAAQVDRILSALASASTAVADVNAAAMTAVETVQASPASEDDGELEDFDGPIAADYYAPDPNNSYLWYPNYNPMAEPYDPRKPSFDDMIPQQEAYDDMLGIKPRGTLSKPKDLVNRLICKECKVDPPNIVEYDVEANLVCGDCGLVLMERAVYYP